MPLNPLADLAPEWERLSPLLDEALALPEEERLTWLDSQATLAPPLKATLRRLLEAPAAAETGQFMRTLQGRLLAAPLEGGPQPGDLVGPWRLVRLLGEGGMGSVFLGERADASLKRAVALKLPRLGWARGLAARMARERDILATLDHPGIARLYDAGVDAQGRPWLALEYVPGRPIDVYASEQGLSVAQRVELLLQVCEAVAHAHARLVIHRDLKPGNILVTDEGQVRLLDFGIASLVQGADGAEAAAGTATAFAARAHTPAYASPEQLRGQTLGTASDVYSLGVVAYELLAGVRPYALVAGAMPPAADDMPAASKAAAGVPGRPAAAARELRGGLDTVLRQALQQEPAQRYASVEALAQDLARARRGQPLQARGEGPWAALQRLLRRHRLALALGAAVLLALLGGAYAQAAVALALAAGAGLALSQRNRARREAEAARREAARAERQAARAERVKRFALSIFDGANPDAGAGARTTALELLQRSRGLVEDELAGDAEAATEMRTALGQALLGLGQAEAAAGLLRAAADEAEQVLGRRAPLAVQARLRQAEAMIALQQAEAALDILEPHLAPSARPDDHALALRLASLALIDLGRSPEALALAERAVAAARALPQPEGAVELLHALSQRVNVLSTSNQKSLAQAKETLAAAQALYGDRRQPPAPLLDARAGLALALVRESRDREAVKTLQAMPEAWAQLLGPRHGYVANAHNLLANALISIGDDQGALEAFERSVNLYREQRDADARVPLRSLGLGLTMVGATLGRLARHEEAIPVLQQAVDVMERAVGDRHARTIYAREQLAISLARRERFDEAWAQLDACGPSELTRFDAERHSMRRAQVLAMQGQGEAALPLMQPMLAHCDVLPPDIAAWIRAGHADVLRAAGRWAEAIEEGEVALAMMRTIWIPGSSVMAALESRLAAWRCEDATRANRPSPHG